MYIIILWKIFHENIAAINHQAAILIEQKLNKRSHAGLQLFIVGKRQDKQIVPLF